MTRFKVFSIHLAVSLAIVALILGLFVFAWYPWPLFDLENGWQGIGLVALVNIVLGPMLSLILFTPGKPGLKFDMTVVVLLQLGALGYGVWQLYDARPVLLVHAADHFQPLSRGLLAEWDTTGAILRRWEGFTPRRIRVDLPADPIAFADLYQKVRHQPGGLHGLADRYQPAEENWQLLLQDAVLIRPYVKHDAEWQRRFTEFTNAVKRPAEELAFFPYVGRRERVFLVFDRITQDIVGVLDIPLDPALVRVEVPRIKRTGRQIWQTTADAGNGPIGE